MVCIHLFLLLFMFENVDGRSGGFMETQLRVMTFNIWVSGAEVDNGIEKIANHIKLVDADIVALQEVENHEAYLNISEQLGPSWSGYYHHSGYPDTAIFTKHTIINESYGQVTAGVGVRIAIKVSQQNKAPPIVANISFWSMHLEWHSYGPYAACNKLVTDKAQIIAGEMNLAGKNPGRVQNIHELLADKTFKKMLMNTAQEPLIVAGDFNAPSHIDWTDDAKDMHCGWSFSWPTSLLLEEQASMIDSYRELHPDPVADPGNTWSTVQKMTDAGWGWTVPEPQDRIDLILYRGKRLLPIDSRTYQGTAPVRPKPYQRQNDYPSDHAAVITDFRFYVGGKDTDVDDQMPLLF